MEAASRPSLEPLPDLPVEAPLDTPAAPAKAAAAVSAPAVAVGESAPAKQTEQTGITFLDPASLVLDTAEVPALSPPVLAAAAPADSSTKEYELTLEDPVVDEMLTAPPPPPLAKSAPVVAAPAAAVAPAVPDSVRTEALVPIARTGSLSSAAAKLAAASQRATEQRAPKPAPAVRAVPPAAPAPSSGA